MKNQVGKLESVFNIKPGETSTVILLLAYSFSLGIFLSYYLSFANAEFLSRFGLGKLALSYIISGLVGYVCGWTFTRMENRLNFDKVLLLTVGFLLALMLAFRILYPIFNDTDWLVFSLLIWVGPTASLMSLQYWSLNAKLFDLRQGKRLFGLISSGDVVSSVIAYLSIPLIRKLLAGQEDLLLISIAGLGFALFFQKLIVRKYKSKLIDISAGPSKAKQRTTGQEQGLKSLLGNVYFRLIFLVTILSVIARYLVDYNFLGITKEIYPDKVQLTVFISLFYGVMKLLELLFKTLVASRVMERFGLKVSLFALPVSILLFSLGGLAGLLVASTAMIFLALTLNKLMEKIMRNSLEGPSFKILYQSLDISLRAEFQNLVEGSGKQVGVIAAGLFLLAGNYLFTLERIDTLIILSVLFIPWSILLLRIYQEYRKVLKNRLVVKSTNEEENAVLIELDDRATDGFSLERVENLIAGEGGIAFYQLIQNYNRCQSAAKNRIVQYLQTVKHPALKPLVENVLTSELDPNRKSALEKLLGQWQDDYTDLNREETPYLALATNQEGKESLALNLHVFPEREQLLMARELIEEDEPRIYALTLLSIAEHKDIDELYELMVTHLYDSDQSNMAYSFLQRQDERLFPVLEEEYYHMEKIRLTDWRIQHAMIKILKLMVTINKKEAQTFLIGKLQGNPDRELFVLTVQLLGELEFHAQDSDIPTVKRLIRREVKNFTWILRSLMDLGKGTSVPKVNNALRQNQLTSIDVIFTLLSFLYEPAVIKSIQAHYNSDDQTKRVIAIEMADVVLEDDLVDLILPVIEHLESFMIYRQLKNFFPQKKMSLPERLQEILHCAYSKVDTWLKLTAIEALDKMSEQVPQVIHAQVYHPNKVLSFAGSQSVLGKTQSKEYLLLKESASPLSPFISKNEFSVDKNKENLKVVALVEDLHGQPLLKNLPIEAILKLAVDAKFLQFDTNETIDWPALTRNQILLIIEGSLIVKMPDGSTDQFREDQYLAKLEAVSPQVKIEVESSVEVLSIRRDDYFNVGQVYGKT